MNKTLQAFLFKTSSIWIGALIFIGIFSLRFASIEPNLYQLRDDGIITLSHAKNLVDFGFVGVNPSGPIVEGTSAPLHFMLYAFGYLVANIGYENFVHFLTLICTLLLGAIVSVIFFDKKYWNYLICIMFASYLAFQSSFIEWHGSGMENSLTHVLLLGSVTVLLRFLWSHKIDYRWVIIPFLASICRIDSVFHLFPILAMFILLWYLAEKNFKALNFSAYVVGPWLAFNFLRYLYFGEWLPNTAYAQDISVIHRIKSLLNFNLESIEQFKFLAKQIYFAHAGHWLLFLLFLPWVDWKKKYAPLIVLSILPVFTALIYPAFFGPSRLDYGRTNTHMPIFVFLLVISIFLSLKKNSLKLSFSTFGLILGFFIYSQAYIKPYYLCCDINGFNQTYQQFKKIAIQEKISRPTVANPDLGIVSWHKDMNIVDLGMIGSPVFSKIKSIEVASDFIFEFSAPDLIESHDIWSCIHDQTIFNDPRFEQMYQPIQEEIYQSQERCGGRKLRNGIWIRKNMLASSKSAERSFFNRLAQELTINHVQAEIQHCPIEHCPYISRTVYKFLPEFKKDGQYETLIQVFENSKTTNDFDWYLLKGSTDNHAATKAFNYLMNRRLKPVAMKQD